MTEPGEMPRPRPGRAVSEWWIDELAVLVAGGVALRHRARTRVRRTQLARRGDDPLFVLELTLDVLQLGFIMYAIDKLFGRWTDPPMHETHAEIALDAVGARIGDLPEVVVDFPVPLAAAVDAQSGQVDVRGHLAPGRAIVLVLDDGEVVGCQYPAMPLPPVGRRAWQLLADPAS